MGKGSMPLLVSEMWKTAATEEICERRIKLFESALKGSHMNRRKPRHLRSQIGQFSALLMKAETPTITFRLSPIIPPLLKAEIEHKAASCGRRPHRGLMLGGRINPVAKRSLNHADFVSETTGKGNRRHG
jgi:hypothetical protein